MFRGTSTGFNGSTTTTPQGDAFAAGLNRVLAQFRARGPPERVQDPAFAVVAGVHRAGEGAYRAAGAEDGRHERERERCGAGARA